jgi:hypothetical protein
MAGRGNVCEMKDFVAGRCVSSLYGQRGETGGRVGAADISAVRAAPALRSRSVTAAGAGEESRTLVLISRYHSRLLQRRLRPVPASARILETAP